MIHRVDLVVTVAVDDRGNQRPLSRTEAKAVARDFIDSLLGTDAPLYQRSLIADSRGEARATKVRFAR